MAPGELQTYFHAEHQAGLLAAGLGVASFGPGVFLQAAILLVFDVFAEHGAHVYARGVETIGA